MNKSKITIIAFFMVGLALGMDWIIQNDYVGLRKNTTESLPFSFFISYQGNASKKGSYVSIQHPKSPSILLAKRIAGVAGDKISISEHYIFINGQNFGRIKDSFSNGETLTPIQEETIPKGYIFAYASHPNSFDSRYEDFGLIDTNNIREVLWPLF